MSELVRVQYRVGHGDITADLFERLRATSRITPQLPILSNDSEIVRVAVRLLHAATTSGGEWFLRGPGNDYSKPDSSAGPLTARGAGVHTENKEVQLTQLDLKRIQQIMEFRRDLTRQAAVVRAALCFLRDIAETVKAGGSVVQRIANTESPIVLRQVDADLHHGATTPTPGAAAATASSGQRDICYRPPRTPKLESDDIANLWSALSSAYNK